MIKRILPPSMIGIIGGGQLGQMMALAMIKQGYRVAVLDPDKDCPCSRIASEFICASYTDEMALKRLIQLVDVVTYEFENVDVETLRKVCLPSLLPQGFDCLRVSQDRLLEKSTIEFLGIPTVKFEAFASLDELYNLSLDYPLIIKTRRFGYDGKGQSRIMQKESVKQLNLQFPNYYIAEQECAFDKEISVIVCGFKDGVIAYEAFENKHIHGILDTSLHPAQITKELQDLAIDYAIKIVSAFNYVGVLAVEFFVKGGQLYFNELAPRPHNSGHGTINNCDYSQFDSHVSAICGSSVIQPKRLQVSIMQNILGQDVEELMHRFATQSTQSTHLHLYGKTVKRLNRKMGHITIQKESIEEVELLAKNWSTHR